MTASIRPKAVCVCRRGEAILVGSAYDASKGETFYGPPGGGVEFGERAIDAVRREMREEITDAEGDQPFTAQWMPLAHFAPGGPPLYPTGLLELLLAPEH